MSRVLDFHERCFRKTVSGRPLAFAINVFFTVSDNYRQPIIDSVFERWIFYDVRPRIEEGSIGAIRTELSECFLLKAVTSLSVRFQMSPVPELGVLKNILRTLSGFLSTFCLGWKMGESLAFVLSIKSDSPFTARDDKNLNPSFIGSRRQSSFILYVYYVSIAGPKT